MSKIKSCLEGEVGDKLMYNSGYTTTITKVEKQSMGGGVLYHLADGGSISTLKGVWRYFSILEKEEGE